MQVIECFKLLNVRRKFCLIFGILGFAMCLFIDFAIGVALASILILLSFVDENNIKQQM